jgi:hypothetical protein
MTDPSSPSGARPAERKTVSSEKLLELLNQRLQGYGNCHHCVIAGPIRYLEEVTEDGRNWSTYLPLVCSEDVGSGCRRIAERIIDDAALEYNLEKLPASTDE